jgi:hypothetical protein
MNRRFWIGWLVVFVVMLASGYLVHSVILGPEYAALTNLFRPEEASEHFWVMILADVIMAGAFTWIYSRGVTAAPWAGQGLRFGIAIALLMSVPIYLTYGVVQPMPAGLVHKQMLLDSGRMIVLGLTIAAIYRSKPAPA